MRENILIIEDEEALRSTLSVRLRGEGYIVETAADGLDGFEKATTQPYDLIILDVLLPDRIGWDVCRDIRQSGMATPILFLTAKTQTIDKVTGLRLGADDYVTKPFKAAELVARIEALLRRVPTRSSRGVYRFGSLLVDLHRGQVTKDDCPVYLSGREFQLLRYLIQRAGISVSREELLREVWGYSASTYTRTIDVHISSLRDKVEEHPRHPELIITVAGVGYKFMGSKAA
jgi:two-component system, OmpR family, alkaline phosphatase synthesis response regulator PhoP